MKDAVKRIIGLVVLSTVLVSLPDIYASAIVPSAGKRSDQEVTAPDFQLETIQGKTVSLKDYKGQGVMLFFFATWCPWCRKKINSFIKDYEQYKRENMAILVIDVGESQRKVESFATKEGVPFDILLDINMKTAEAYDVVGVPTFILVSGEGKIVFEGNEIPENYKSLLSK